MTAQELCLGDLFWQPCVGWIEGGGAKELRVAPTPQATKN